MLTNLSKQYNIRDLLLDNNNRFIQKQPVHFLIEIHLDKFILLWNY